MAAFRSGERRSAWHGPNRPTDLMLATAESATEAEVAEAARYFSGLSHETPGRGDRIGQRAGHARGRLAVRADGGRVPRAAGPAHHRGGRRSRAPRTARRKVGIRGLRATGKHCARTRTSWRSGGDGVTLPCGSCHGADLRGAGLVPPIAGRSPTYILRQLIGFRTGARAGAERRRDATRRSSARRGRHDRDRSVHRIAGALTGAGGQRKPRCVIGLPSLARRKLRPFGARERARAARIAR